jgi:HlyD family secretion protein
MSTQSQDPRAKALQQPSVKAEVAKSVAPPSPASTPQGGGTGPKRNSKLKAWLIVAAVVLVGAGAAFAWAKYTGTDLVATLTTAWHKLMGSDVPEGFAQTNGRLEATKVYITTKAPLRVETILVKEGDYVNAGQVVSRMDTRTLQAQLRQAEAKIQRAKDAKATAIAQAAEREADLVLAKSQLERSRKLIEKGGASQQQLDVDTAKWKTAGSALDAAKSQVVESQSAIDAAIADADKLRVDVEDGVLVAPRHGRIQYRLAEQGEVLPAGGRVLDMIDLTDVYMLFYLPEDEAGKATIGAEARLIFDALPDVVIPATVYFVAAEAQFTPKAVETRTERQKLAFQVRARIDSALLTKYEPYVKTGLPGVIYVRLDPKAQWPERLHVKIPEPRGAQP